MYKFFKEKLVLLKFSDFVFMIFLFNLEYIFPIVITFSLKYFLNFLCNFYPRHHHHPKMQKF